MATSRGKSIEYGWLKDKTTSKLVELTPKLLHFPKLLIAIHTADLIVLVFWNFGGNALSQSMNVTMRQKQKCDKQTNVTTKCNYSHGVVSECTHVQ